MKDLSKTILSILFMMVCTIAHAQKIDVSGTVLDPLGESVIGATIMEKGTTNGVVTDLDGNFSLKVNKGAIVVFDNRCYLLFFLRSAG